MIQYSLSVVISVKKIDREKLAKEICDTIIHRKCVIRSGFYLATFLEKENREDIARQLIKRCLTHDMSKLEDTREFAALASIVDQRKDMTNVEHVLTDAQKKAISLHWEHNSHHPEHFENPNDMSELDILEMTCDCHARSKQFHTNLLQYIHTQQRIRFHFDMEHYTMLARYCYILEQLTKNDNYQDLLVNNIAYLFEANDPVIYHLENFTNTKYVDKIETERLILNKSKKSDFSSIIYFVRLKETDSLVGEITILCNGKIYYKVPKKYQEQGYIQEALNKFKEIITRKELSLDVGDKNLIQEKVANDLGFELSDVDLEGIRTYKFVKQQS